jgi:hypothetical protein
MRSVQFSMELVYGHTLGSGCGSFGNGRWGDRANIIRRRSQIPGTADRAHHQRSVPPLSLQKNIAQSKWCETCGEVVKATLVSCATRSPKGGPKYAIWSPTISV